MHNRRYSKQKSNHIIRPTTVRRSVSEVARCAEGPCLSFSPPPPPQRMWGGDPMPDVASFLPKVLLAKCIMLPLCLCLETASRLGNLFFFFFFFLVDVGGGRYLRFFFIQFVLLLSFLLTLIYVLFIYRLIFSF